MANTHHVMLIVWSMYNCIYPDCEDAYPFKKLHDDLCWVQIDKKMVYCLFMTGAYMIAELVLGEIYIRDRSKLGKQLLVHHFLAIAIIYMVLSIGSGAIFLG